MSSGPVIGVLALQGDVREHARVLEELGVRALGVRRPEELAGLDGIVFPGGESTTIDKLSRAFGLRDLLRDALQSGLPAYGSCAGMILLADRLEDGRPDQETFGGIDMTVRRNAFGRQVDSFETNLDFAHLGSEPVHAVFIRAPWVEKVGPAVEVLACVPEAADLGAAAGKIVAVRQGALLATSFHPEMTGERRVHELFVQMVREQGT